MLKVKKEKDRNLLFHYLIINHNYTKAHFKTLLLLLLPVFGIAQDKIVTITPGMFDKVNDEASLSATDGWLFRLGNDSA